MFHSKTVYIDFRTEHIKIDQTGKAIRVINKNIGKILNPLIDTAG